MRHADSSKRLRLYGWLAVFGSAFFFYLATAIIHWANQIVEIDTALYVFSRLALGFILVSLTMLWQRQRPRPRRYHLLFGRTIFNVIATFCFYQAVTVTSVAEANILNMTYPLFIAVIAWFLLREQRDLVALPVVLVAFVGIWLILAPGDLGFSRNNLWGLASGVIAAVAMLYLNLSRRYHDSQTILFFMFGPGSLLILLLFPEAFFFPNLLEVSLLLVCSACGVLAQYLLTFGFRYVTAVEGSVISSTRILLAALLGPLLLNDPPLTSSGWLGAVLVFTANIILAVRRSNTTDAVTHQLRETNQRTSKQIRTKP
ncbi:MAG: EamA family transporter [Desulfobulbus propionicus]|nr:MAG: EamA family transporter [Desulfobulbus propionicus]